MIFSLYVINKAGGLIYQKNFNDGLKQLSSNDYLILAGTFHGVHAISSQISPVPGSSGIEILETNHFTLRCFQTLTGTKFLLFTDPRQRDPDAILKRVYEIYADYVMKASYHRACGHVSTDLCPESLLSDRDADSMCTVRPVSEPIL